MAADDPAADFGAVTGSHHASTAIEGALPLFVIDRDQIEQSGHVMLADLLRTHVLNSAGSFRPQSGSSAQSFAGFAMQALGEGRTMILVDGRVAPIAPNVGSAQDLNAIPLAMVERIELLPSGSAAIYGRNAAAGVINIITRREFTGAEISIAASDPVREGGDTAEFSALMGIDGDRGHMMFGVTRSHRDIVFARDREWSSGDYSLYANNFAVSTSNLYGNPTHGAAVPGDGCVGDQFTTLGTAAASRTCYYEYSAVSADDAEVGNMSLYLRSGIDINDEIELFLDASVGRVESFGRYAPSPSSPWPGGLPVISAGSPNHPATSPANGGLNPFWADYQDIAGQDIFLSHRFVAAGNRDTYSDANVYDMDIGLRGDLLGLPFEFGLRNVESRYIDLGRDYVVSAIAQQFIDSGEYNIYQPLDVPEDVASSIAATINRDAMYREKAVYFSAASDLLALPAGMVRLSFGGEYREEDLEDRYDSLSEGRQVAGSAGDSSEGGRNVKSFFAEGALPILDGLDTSLALRYDDHSDVGGLLSTRLAAVYDVSTNLRLRATWSQGENAPSLDRFPRKARSYQTAVIIPWAGIGFPPPNPVTVTGYEIPNPDLGPETVDSITVGVEFKPWDWLNASADFISTEIEDRVRYVSAQTIINCIEWSGSSPACDAVSVLDETAAEPQPQSGLGAAFSNLPNLFSVLYFQTGYTNLGSISSEEMVLRLDTEFAIFGGLLRNHLVYGQLMEYSFEDGSDLVGTRYIPDERLRLENSFDFGDFQFAWNINRIGREPASYGSWNTQDVQLAWSAPWNATLAIGVINLGDTSPPLDAGETRGYIFDLFDGYGRQPYLRYTQQF